MTQLEEAGTLGWYGGVLDEAGMSPGVEIEEVKEGPDVRTLAVFPATRTLARGVDGCVPYQINFPSFCPFFVSSTSLPHLTLNPSIRRRLMLLLI